MNTANESVSVSCQTDIDQLEMEELVKNVARLKIESKVLRNKVNNKAAMKRELFMDNVLNNDESVKFYTGLPPLTFLMAIFNILKPLAEKLKYWDSNKGNKVNFQMKPSVRKSGKKRNLTTFQEFILTLVRLRLGLLVQHLSDIFAIFQIFCKQSVYHLDLLPCYNLERHFANLAYKGVSSKTLTSVL